MVKYAFIDSLRSEYSVIKVAVASRNIEPGLILHSDRGVQYRSWEYQPLLLDEKIQPGMSHKGMQSWGNAAMESFFARFKVEAR